MPEIIIEQNNNIINYIKMLKLPYLHKHLQFTAQH